MDSTTSSHSRSASILPEMVRVTRDDDELRVKPAARRLLNDKTEEATREAIRLSLSDSSAEAATDEQSRPRPRELLGGTSLDHDEDALTSAT